MEQNLEYTTEFEDYLAINNMTSCRVCLKSFEPMCTLYERCRSISYADMLRCVTRIIVNKDEGLPDKICCKCRIFLEKAFIFKAVAEKSDARLKLLKKINHDFSTPGVKKEYLKEEEYEDIDEYKNIDSNESVRDVKTEYVDFESETEHSDKDVEDMSENKESVFDDHLYNSEPAEVLTFTNKNGHQKGTKRAKGQTDKIPSKRHRNSLLSTSQTRRRKRSSQTGIPEKLVCPVCGLMVTSLPRHMQSHNERKLPCPECPKLFHKASNLRNHMKYHKGDKNYVCSECGLAFLDRRGLNRHSSVHTGVKPYTCELCAKTFIAGNTLKQHMEIHAGTKRYKCDVCGTHFRAPHQLKAHSIIHTGDKPYYCEVCNQGFSYKVNLNNHANKVHNVDLKFKSVQTLTYELLKELPSKPKTHLQKGRKWDRSQKWDKGQKFDSSEMLLDIEAIDQIEQEDEIELLEEDETDDNDIEIGSKVIQMEDLDAEVIQGGEVIFISQD